MGIQLISGFGGVSSYYKASEIQPVGFKEVSRQSGQAETARSQTGSVSPEHSAEALHPSEDLRSKTVELENISLTFNKEDSFDYIGSESGLANLDMQKAISDMQKDKILQEYQYFVGTNM